MIEGQREGAGQQRDNNPPPRGTDELIADSLDLAAPVLGTPDLLTTAAEQLEHLLQAQDDAWRAEFGAGLAGIIRMLRKGRPPDRRKAVHAFLDEQEAARRNIAKIPRAEIMAATKASSDTVRRTLEERTKRDA
jgi:hypothetical protein